jgi:hypothetical protein
MTHHRNARWLFPLVVLTAAAVACNLPGVTVTLDGDQAASPPAGAVPTTPPTATSEAPPVDVVTPESTPTAPIVHLVTPGEPPLASRYMTDRSSLALASERRSIADDFNNNVYERPFSSQTMDYKGYLDLTRGEIAGSAPWIYVTLFLEAPPDPAEPASYAVEIDLDLDGRGDWLIVAAAPPDGSWTTDGVRVYQDANNDVGAHTPVRNDPPPQTGDGYETLVFDQGVGPDPDAAWVRLPPQGGNRVQIAFKHGLILSDNEFLWGGWTFADPQPGWFDLHDHFSIQQAGSPLSESSYYPLQALALMDNTCRWGYDFDPAPSLPGVCRIPPTPTPTVTPSKTPTPTYTLPIIY